MILAEPLWLAALAALPFAALVFAWLARRDRDALDRLVARPLWGRVVRRTSDRWQWLRAALLLIGAAGIVVALARPQWGIVRERVEREGVDVVLVLDTSGSMATADVAPSRFFLARQALLQLVSRLEGDRFALVAFEGEAYPLVPLTLDADAVGLFLDTAEPGIVPAPGTSVGVGLAKGLSAFVDEERRNKVMVLVSDGEDLEGDVDAAVRAAKEKGVVVQAVGVGTEAGQPVPETDADGKVTGYKRDESGNPVVSRLQMQTLEAIARGTGGQTFRITPTDTSLSRLAAAIEGLEQKSFAQEWSYRRKERFQVPLAVGLAFLAAGLLLPVPRLRRNAASEAGAKPAAKGAGSAEARPRAGASRAAGLVLVAALAAANAGAQAVPGGAPAQSPAVPPAAASPSPASGPRRGPGSVFDEVLLRPRRATAEARGEYERGNHPRALEAFERAAGTRPADPAVRFNLADGLYKNARYDEAAAAFGALKDDPRLGAISRFNLGNSLYQKQDYKAAVQAYREALRAAPNDADTRRNLEMALRAIQQQEEQQRKQQQQQDQQKQDDKQDKKNQKQKGQQGQDQQKKDQPQGQDQQKQQQQQQEQGKQDQQQARQDQPKPQTPQERADQRFREETGMPRERAMQLLDALQQNEKAEQKKALAVKRAQKKKGKDW
jgi:Ca-activated chloride channel family protein